MFATQKGFEKALNYYQLSFKGEAVQLSIKYPNSFCSVIIAIIRKIVLYSSSRSSSDEASSSVPLTNETVKETAVKMAEASNKVLQTIEIENANGAGAELINLSKSNELTTTIKPQPMELKIITTTFVPAAEANK